MLAQRIQHLEKENSDYRKIVDLDREQLERLVQTQENLNAGLEAFLADNKIGIQRKQNRIILELSDKFLFDPGSVRIKPSGFSVLEQVGKVVMQGIQGMQVQVGGHTDNVPTRGHGHLASNWGLSAARAVQVVQFLEKKVGLNPKKLAAVGFGEHRPLVSNKNARGRALNRRIEIILLAD